jgi:hypothetical protein
VRNVQGEVFPVVIQVEKWATRAEQVIKEAEAEHRAPQRIDLAASMAALEGEAA